MKSYSIMALLTFFLGGIGAHKFYQDKPVLGILYFLFSWTFIPVCIAFIELIVLLAQGKETFDKKYNA